MDESLIGHEASFSLPCDPSIIPLLMGFMEELLLVGGSDIEAPEQVEERIRVAIDEICGSPGAIEAILSIVAEGVELRLCRAGGGQQADPILVREE